MKRSYFIVTFIFFIFSGSLILYGHTHDQFSANIFPLDNQPVEQERYILLVNNHHMEFALWKNGIEKAGLQPRHWFPPEAAILVFHDQDNLQWDDSIPATLYADLTAEQVNSLSTISEPMRAATHAFLKLINKQISEAEEEFVPTLGASMPDALIRPIQRQYLSPCSTTYLKRSNSEYMLRSVSINVILPESTGAIDVNRENWSATRENSVAAEVVEAMNFMAAAYTGPALLRPSFVYHYYFGRTNAVAQTSYEPISRSSDSGNEPGSGEGLWTNQIYNNLGYSAYGDRWTKGEEFNGNTRISDGTFWAVTMFIVDSLNDTDGYFADGYFAYAWLGGPHLVMTYDNDNWGITRMDMVTRHETSHSFFVLDEYQSSGCTCSATAGYINYQNQNCESSCLTNGNCIMSSATKQQAGVVCNYTRGQIGWGDSNTNGIPDPVDNTLNTTLTAYSPDPTTNTLLNYQGTATAPALTNQNHYGYYCDINVVRIATVQYNVDGGAWNNASPCDGQFNSGSECYNFSVLLAPGTHTIQTRTVDELSRVDTTPASDTITITPSQVGTLLSHRPAVNDTGTSTPNGVIEENETVALIGNLQNTGGSTAASVTATLSATDPITISDGSAAYPDILPGGSQNCTNCYSLNAPAANRPMTHWDFNVLETSTCTACTQSKYNFIYHVGNSFDDVPPSVIFYPFIETVLHSGVTSGCSVTMYCPLNTVQRQQMAKFICSAMNAVSANSCPAASCSGTFTDVPTSNMFCSYIEALYTIGIVSGCQTSPLQYCPASTTQRGQMAKFICSGMQTANPGSCVTGTCSGIFTDVPASNPFCPYVEALYNAGVISGCSATQYCPNNNVSREQMSKFLVNGFDFTL